MIKYNKINNALGWLCFVVAAITYILTLEPTASFWDCPEFILQAFKLEVGHPPGNPIFMLAGRFFVNLAGGDITKVAYMVNLMSGLLSAGTILLLFWTITHMVKRLTVADDMEPSPVQTIVIMASGLCGALAYTWSDTFWFSAVEGEVYAFSSFCTALVIWLILKWESRADEPQSDKYLILIAYVIGISIAVHLLNLLCIPAIGLVVYYRKFKQTTARGSLITIGLSAIIIGLILYGLVPGFIEISQYFELLFVNQFGMSYNMGVLIYAVLLVASFVWTISLLYRGGNLTALKFSILVSITLSGIFFIGDNLLIPLVLTIALAVWLFTKKSLPMRVLNIAVISILVIFIGYSSYALLLIRSSANPPMNQNAPDNVFSLASYLNREQYGDRPLLYGQTINSSILYEADVNTGAYNAIDAQGAPIYGKTIKTDASQPDKYECIGYKHNYKYTPELNMLFPRMYSGAHAAAYKDWTGMTGVPVDATVVVDNNGTPLSTTPKIKPTFMENMRFFFAYQLNHMYWRYFMWNFAGRQNDIQGNGEVNHGNWISGIPFIDNPRLGDQSLLPYDEGEGNAGHNVFFMLPLLMGIIGLLWQAFVSKRGIEQFWVVFFLFFMTGIAIVIYLNQTPTQPRERDYAFAGSFYAYAIWVGMGVAGIYHILTSKIKSMKKDTKVAAAIAAVVGILIPLQMVSQTWDDHDRSGRYAARDYGMNYLNSLDENAIIFTNGDNDTFPLWYAQEVEGVRTDVKVVNQSYLTTSWYIDMMRQPTYEAAGIDMLALPQAYGHDKMQFVYFDENMDSIGTDALLALSKVYAPESRNNHWGVPMMKNSVITIPVDIQKALAAKHLSPEEAAVAQPYIALDLKKVSPQADGLTVGNVMTLDMLATSMKNGWNRPIYFAMTVPDDYYIGLSPWMRATGLAYEVTPVYAPLDDYGEIRTDTDRTYRNITEKFRWGGLDTAKGALYLDETVRRMAVTNRTAMLSLADALLSEGYQAKNLADSVPANKEAAALAKDRFNKAKTILTMIEEKVPAKYAPYAIQEAQRLAILWNDLGNALGDKKMVEHSLKVMKDEVMRMGRNVLYYQSLTPNQYATLQRTDQYIDKAYLGSLLQYYGGMGGDAEALAKELAVIGVDLNRVFAAFQDTNN